MSNFYDKISDEAQKKVLKDVLNPTTDNPDDIALAEMFKNALNLKAEEAIHHILMTSGPYQGETREIFYENGRPYYFSGKKKPKKLYLEPLLDHNGNVIEPITASGPALAKWKSLFPEPTPPAEEPFPLFTTPEKTVAQSLSALSASATYDKAKEAEKDLFILYQSGALDEDEDDEEEEEEDKKVGPA